MDQPLPAAEDYPNPNRHTPDEQLQLAGVVPASPDQPGDDRSEEHHRWRRRLHHRHRHVSRR